ncbi:hypothetical protein CY0110_18792 [Crocosphaera chwakensis CCY0110]|uniref:Uncharacterized protein n=1 Tax=Crocosphaera chwakensis CCY0110 TaxID=391612 RepID=A3IJ90_9CHRO|nr:hypothetical protein CY0110_18792 [Crocosphaera chwakensis CCY0110]
MNKNQSIETSQENLVNGAFLVRLNDVYH